MADVVKNTAPTRIGVPGLDEVLGGGLPQNHLYLIQGEPGRGKTTLTMRFPLSEMIGTAIENTLFHPSELELTKTISQLLKKIEATNPTRIIFDLISEPCLMSENSFRYRRLMLADQPIFEKKWLRHHDGQR